MQIARFRRSNNLVAMFFTRARTNWATSRSCRASTTAQWQLAQLARSGASKCRAARRGAARDSGCRHGDRVMLVSREPARNGRSPTSRSWPRAASPCPTYITNTERDHPHILDEIGRQGGDRLDRRSWPSRCCRPSLADRHRRACDRHRAAALRADGHVRVPRLGRLLAGEPPPRRRPSTRASPTSAAQRPRRASSTPAAPAAARAA